MWAGTRVVLTLPHNLTACWWFPNNSLFGQISSNKAVGDQTEQSSTSNDCEHSHTKVMQIPGFRPKRMGVLQKRRCCSPWKHPAIRSSTSSSSSSLSLSGYLPSASVLSVCSWLSADDDELTVPAEEGGRTGSVPSPPRRSAVTSPSARHLPAIRRSLIASAFSRRFLSVSMVLSIGFCLYGVLPLTRRISHRQVQLSLEELGEYIHVKFLLTDCQYSIKLDRI